MELDFAALYEDAVSARATLFKAHCEKASDPHAAVIALASVLMGQAQAALEAAYGGDKKKARQHALLVAGELTL